jgi:hypothetical protein
MTLRSSSNIDRVLYLTVLPSLPSGKAAGEKLDHDAVSVGSQLTGSNQYGMGTGLRARAGTR